MTEGFPETTVLVAVTPHDQDNLVAGQVAARRFGVPRTLALVNDPENVEIFRRLGVSAAISTTDVMTMLVEQHADFEEIKNLLPVAGGAGFAIIMLASLAGPPGLGLLAAEGRTDQLVPQVPWGNRSGRRSSRR